MTTLIPTILALLFFVPIVSAFSLIYDHLYHHPQNHGSFVCPPLSVKTLKLKTYPGLSPSLAELHGHWLLMYTHTLPCDNTCKRHLADLFQIHHATGYNENIISKIWVTNPHGKRTLARSRSKEHLHNNYFYVGDPTGKLILSYPADTPPPVILTDLRHLLRPV